MKLFFSVLVILLLIPLTALSQDKYKVVYDYSSENISYYKLDKSYNVIDTLNNPKIKRNSLVEIKLKNVNPFAVDVVTDVKEEQIHQSGDGFNFTSLLGGINTFSSDNLNLNVANLPAGEFLKSDSRGSVTSGFSDLNEKTANVSALKTTIMSNLLNPNLSKEDIVESVIETAGLQQDARLPDPNDNFYVFLTQLEKIVQEDKAELEADVNAMSKDVDQQTSKEEGLSRGELIERNYLISDLQSLLSSLNKSTFQTVEDLKKIKSLYTMLEASDFSRTYDYQLEADKVNIEVKFVQSVFAKNAHNENTGSTLKTRNIKLYSKGGFKINTGVALTLNNFGSKSQDFYIAEDGTIGADNNNYFTPNLSTMINFYPYTGENFNIGGSFGLSIPISGESNVKGVSFLLGPSLHFGSKSRVSISGGLAYGPVQKLTNGLEVGDPTTFGSVDNFTKDVYDFGYFFGISFSLFDLN
ncbi:hypothetical protein [Seonamhaeicola maritimus]|uniref:hypothetical protein n=1 Tax=Seonamhaeicola maritimus TaxID=2591822 RepID=UPI0024953D16|nr:hypothetical protein [Seonamhaeicola maritimus]